MRSLKLTTSRPAGYRRGGQVIGQAAAPTLVTRDGLDRAQLMAILGDPNVAIAMEVDEGKFERLPDDERAEALAHLKAETEEKGREPKPAPAPAPSPPPPPPPSPPPPAEKPEAKPAAKKAPAKKAPAKKAAAKTSSASGDGGTAKG